MFVSEWNGFAVESCRTIRDVPRARDGCAVRVCKQNIECVWCDWCIMPEASGTSIVQLPSCGLPNTHCLYCWTNHLCHHSGQFRTEALSLMSFSLGFRRARLLRLFAGQPWLRNYCANISCDLYGHGVPTWWVTSYYGCQQSDVPVYRRTLEYNILFVAGLRLFFFPLLWPVWLDFWMCRHFNVVTIVFQDGRA